MGRPSSREPLGVLPKATALTPYYLAFTPYLSWPTGTTTPYHLPPTPYAPTSTTHLYHLYHLYYPGGEMPKKVCWSKAKCIAAPHLWDLDHSEAWRGHPLAKSLALLEHTLYAPTVPLFGIVPSTRSQPLPEWLV